MRPFGKKREIYVLILNDDPADVWCAVVYDVLSPEMDLLYFSDRDSLARFSGDGKGGFNWSN